MTIYCDECDNFPPPDSKKWGDDAKRDYYCMVGVKMQFAPPRGPADDEWGFCKTRCKEFAPKTKARPQRRVFVPVVVARHQVKKGRE